MNADQERLAVEDTSAIDSIALEATWSREHIRQTVQHAF